MIFGDNFYLDPRAYKEHECVFLNSNMLIGHIVFNVNTLL